MRQPLTLGQIEHYRTNGYVSPIRVMSIADAQALRGRLEAFESREGRPLDGSLRHKAHLLFPWLNELIRHERILDAVESLYGPNLLCWMTNFFIKEANDSKFVSWHQDSTYWGLSEPDVVTAWVALTESNISNGAMRVIPRSQLLDQLPHQDTFAQNNLLTRGQEVAVEVDERQAVTIELQPGEMSLHHVRIIHGSPPNTSSHRRIGFAIRYIPTYVRQLLGEDSATLVRGVDQVRSFAHEPSPTCELDSELVELHRKAMEQSSKILYRGTDRAR